MYNIASYKPRVLFTGYYFDSFSGSMMHICELGEYYKQLGYEIYIATVYITDKIYRYVEDLGLNVYVANELPIDIKYDIVWAYHFPILPYLISRGVMFNKLVAGCLSGLLTPLETPQEVAFGLDIPIFVNSEETKLNLIKKFPNLKKKLYKLINIVPERFYQYRKQRLEDHIHKIAIVSNHIVDELKGIIEPLKLMHIKVDCYGGIDNNPITPNILCNYDVIITIGKTVQYALVMGIPVYNYDIYGGSGYICLENIDKEEFYNFSGRSQLRKLNYDDIICEILGYYKEIRAQMTKLQEIAVKRYLISNVMSEVLRIIDTYNSIKFDCSDSLYTIQNSFLLNEIMQKKDDKQQTYECSKSVKLKCFKLFKSLFSVTNEYSNNIKHKVITILGVKIKFKIPKTLAPVKRERVILLNEDVCRYIMYVFKFRIPQFSA